MSIWDYKNLADQINNKYQLSLGEGHTDLDEYKISGTRVFIKKEYQNPTCSFKDRSLAYQLSIYKREHITKAVISSSGNAAISAIAYANLANIHIEVFVSEKIETKKLENLTHSKYKNFNLHKSLRPKSDAIQYSHKNHIPNLRGSTDENAITGFKTISYELIKQNPDIDAIFIPCSSGTSTVGIFHGYQELQKNIPGHKIPALHIVQTEKIHPMAKDFDSDFLRRYTSLASAISDRVANRKEQVIEVLHRTNGFGWVISDAQIHEAIAIAEKYGIDFESTNSILSLAGYLKAARSNYNFTNPCLIFSGT